MIIADYDTLMKQSHWTAALYMNEAKKAIDSTFGEGYAAKNSNLVGQFMMTAAIDMAGATVAKNLGSVCQQICDASDNIVNAMPVVS